MRGLAEHGGLEECLSWRVFSIDVQVLVGHALRVEKGCKGYGVGAVHEWIDSPTIRA